jgi:hypothetical protein
MKKSNLIVAVSVIVLLILLGTGFWYWQTKKNSIIITPEVINEAVVPLVSTNPLDNKPNINPIDQTNPYKNIKTNPFQ